MAFQEEFEISDAELKAMLIDGANLISLLLAYSETDGRVPGIVETLRTVLKSTTYLDVLDDMLEDSR